MGHSKAKSKRRKHNAKQMVKYTVNVAPSARSACQTCKAKIDKGALRIGKVENRGDFEATKYIHPGCWRPPRTVKTASDLEGLDELDSDQKKEINQCFDEAKKRATSPKRVALKEGGRADYYSAQLLKYQVKELKEILKINSQV